MTTQHSLWSKNFVTDEWDLLWDCRLGGDKTPFTQEENPHSFVMFSKERPTAVVSFAPVQNAAIERSKEINDHWGFGTCH